MTAKDKAIEIMSMYRPIINNSMSKECAIIHVKGIIEVLDIFPRYQMTSFEIERLDYWKEVLTELNQM